MLQYGEGSYGNVFDRWFDDECRGRDNDPIGKDIETPQHLVKVGVFYLSKMDVTRGEFAVFAKETGLSGAGCRTVEHGRWIFDYSAGWENPGFPQTQKDPVVCVSWNDAEEYIA